MDNGTLTVGGHMRGRKVMLAMAIGINLGRIWAYTLA